MVKIFGIQLLDKKARPSRVAHLCTGPLENVARPLSIKLDGYAPVSRLLSGPGVQKIL